MRVSTSWRDPQRGHCSIAAGRASLLRRTRTVSETGTGAGGTIDSFTPSF